MSVRCRPMSSSVAVIEHIDLTALLHVYACNVLLGMYAYVVIATFFGE